MPYHSARYDCKPFDLVLTRHITIPLLLPHFKQPSVLVSYTYLPAPSEYTIQDSSTVTSNITITITSGRSALTHKSPQLSEHYLLQESHGRGLPIHHFALQSSPSRVAPPPLPPTITFTSDCASPASATKYQYFQLPTSSSKHLNPLSAPRANTSLSMPITNIINIPNHLGPS